jgi:putative membrane protein
MRKTLFTMSAAAALVGLLSSPAAAQVGSEDKPRTDTPATAPSQDQPGQERSQSRSDRQFIDKAANDGLAEVKLGQLASEKASNPEVKQYAQRLVQDHTKANNQLKQIAQAEGVRVEDDLESKHRKVHDRLSKLSGEAFDRAYMEYMVEDHQKAVKLFEKGSKEADNPQLKQFASSTLPTLQEHLREAQRLHAEIGGARGTTGTTERDSDRDHDGDHDRDHGPQGHDDDPPSGVSDQPDSDREAPAPRQ